MRPYTPADRGACLAAFESNLPRYFSPDERELFERFLAGGEGEYLVAVDDAGSVVGCGGIAHDSDGDGCLTWGMVHADHQKKGSIAVMH